MNWTVSLVGAVFYDWSHVAIGSDSVAGYTTSSTARPVAFPSSVLVGECGEVGTFMAYTDSSKTTRTGSSVPRFSEEADAPASSESVVVVLTDESHNTANQMTASPRVRYRLTRDGQPIPIAVKIDSRTGHGAYTRH